MEQSTLVAQKWDDNCQNYGHRVCGLAEFTRSVGDFEFKLPWAARYFNKLVSHRSQVAVPDEQRPCCGVRQVLPEKFRSDGLGRGHQQSLHAGRAGQPQVDFVFGGDTFVCEVCLFVRRRTPRDTVFPQSFPIAAI